MSWFPTRRVAIAATSLAAICFQPAAYAQSNDDDSWRITVGAGAVSTPLYPGSGEQDTRAVPIIRADYGRFFFGNVPGLPESVGLGARLWQQGELQLGAAVTTDLRDIRKESDAQRLAGLGDVEGTQRVALFGVYSIDRFTFRAALAPDVGGNDLGLVGAVEADVAFRPTERLSLAIGPIVTFADSEYTNTVFGVTPEQSARSGMPAYQAGSGITSVRLAAAANYQFAPRWMAGVRFMASRLQGDAADSPITEDKSQNSASVFVAYTF